MTKKQLGRTGLLVSRIGVASFSMAPRHHKASEFRSRDVERAFHELGVNTFLVHPLMPEIVKGVRNLIAAGYRKDLVLISEVGIPLAGSTRRGLHLHLRRLGTDHLDVWLFGWVRAPWHLRPAVWNSMRKLKEQGLTKAIGFSSHDRALIAKLQKSHDPDVLMVRYNAAHRGAEREVFKGLAADPQLRPGVIAYTATRWAMLLEPQAEHGFPSAMKPADCYRFVLSHPAVDMVWCAASGFRELAEDVSGVASGPLDEIEMAAACRFGDAVHATASGGHHWMFGSRSN